MCTDMRRPWLHSHAPREEGSHILGHLRCGGWCAVIVVDTAIGDGGRHANPSSREVGVVVLRVSLGNAGRDVLVAARREEQCK